MVRKGLKVVPSWNIEFDFKGLKVELYQVRQRQEPKSHQVGGHKDILKIRTQNNDI